MRARERGCCTKLWRGDAGFRRNELVELPFFSLRVIFYHTFFTFLHVQSPKKSVKDGW
jgi:hypothetical protein